MTPEEKEIERLNEFPLSIREYFTSIVEYDETYDRDSLSHLRRFDITRYPINDRKYGSNQTKVCNIIYNALSDDRVIDLIEEYLDDGKWVFHPFKPFERYDTIANKYYGAPDEYWVILLFNGIVDPFKATEEFNIIRVPDNSFIGRVPRDFNFSYTYGKF